MPKAIARSSRRGLAEAEGAVQPGEQGGEQQRQGHRQEGRLQGGAQQARRIVAGEAVDGEVEGDAARAGRIERVDQRQRRAGAGGVLEAVIVEQVRIGGDIMGLVAEPRDQDVAVRAR